MLVCKDQGQNVHLVYVLAASVHLCGSPTHCWQALVCLQFLAFRLHEVAAERDALSTELRKTKVQARRTVAVVLRNIKPFALPSLISLETCTLPARTGT